MKKLIEEFDEIFTDGVNGSLVYNSKEQGRVSSGVKLYIEKAIKQFYDDIMPTEALDYDWEACVEYIDERAKEYFNNL